MKKLKKFWIIFLVILQVGVPVFSAMTLVSKTAYATENNSSEMLEKTEQSEKTEDTEDTVEDTTPSTASAEEKETTSSSVEPQITDDKPTQESKSASATSESTEPQKSITASDLTRAGEFTFDASIQTEGTGGLELLDFRSESESGEVTADWKVLRNVGYNLRIAITGYPSGNATDKRQVKVVIPQGLLVMAETLDNLVSSNRNIIRWSFEKNKDVVVNRVNADFKEQPFIDTVSKPNSYSRDYITGATIVFDLEPERTEEGFSFIVFPNFEDNTNNSPNFWTGVSGDSLTRNQPVTVELIEGTESVSETVSKKVLDDIYIPSTTTCHHITGNPEVSGSTTPGPQTLGKVMHIVTQVRLRSTESAPNSAYYMGNTTFQAYVPYKELGEGKYLSAKLETDEMTAWINRIAESNNGTKIIDFSYEKQLDGRVIVTYSFVKDDQEYLLQTSNLHMYYSYPENEDEQGNKFEIGNTIYYTENNLGLTFNNYEYDDSGNATMKGNPVFPLTDSNSSLKISSATALDLDFLQEPGSKRYSTVSLNDTGAVTLLDYALIHNKSTAQGDTRVEYKIDTTNDWNYGVTTIQFWTVDSTFGGGLEKPREHTYEFDFVLQEKGDKLGEKILKGTYKLTPKDEYKDVMINRNDGVKRELLGYKDGVAEERYFYYVNRDMLAKGIKDELPNDFNLANYYIKELSYNLYISAGEGKNYVSGIGNRPKESGGQLYGHTFGPNLSKGTNSFSITPTDGVSERKETTHTTTLIEKAAASNYDLTLFLNNKMSVKRENGTQLTSVTNRVNVGEKLSVSATALSCFYPYGSLSYSPEPVFIIRTPVAFDLDLESIKLNQEGKGKLKYDISPEPTVLEDGSKIYYVAPTDSNGLGFYNEDRNEIGEAITIDYEMTVNIAAEDETIKYQELLFIADKKYKNGTGLLGSYKNYIVADEWGIAGSEDDQAAFYRPKGTLPHLMTTNLGYQFSINPPVLDFDLKSSLTLDKDLNSEKIGGVLDKEATKFDATFSMSNVKHNGYVEKDGRFMIYLPVAKYGIRPEWATPSQINEFSLSLSGPVKLIKSTKNVRYEIRYTTANNLKFNDGTASFDGTQGEYAEYVDYDTITQNGSDLANLDNVTMVKIVAIPTDENAHLIPFNEEMSFKMPLVYSSSNLSPFEDYTGEITEWTPYAVQTYTLNGTSNEFRDLATENSVRIRYRPEKFEEVIWAYNENDYRPGTPEADLMSKVVEIPLPDFKNKFNLQIDKLKPQDIVDMILEKTEAFIGSNTNKSVNFGNSHFGFDVGLNSNGNHDHDLFDAQDGIIKIGETLTSGNKLSYKIYNGDNINDPNGDKSITIKYNSINDAGEITDDIEFEVTLKILRKPSIIKAETTLIAGKEYSTIAKADENSKITLKDGAFTAQFSQETDILSRPLEEDKEMYLEFGSIGLPPKDTVLMKVQSKIDDKTEVIPEYYYYKNESDTPQKVIMLTDFTKMGTTTGDNGRLTMEKISDHIEKATQLSYLFIFDFANSKNAVEGNNTISLKYEVGGWADNMVSDFKIDPRRVITNETANPAPSVTYEQREPIDVNGKFTLSELIHESLTAGLVDAYNKDKHLSLSLSLHKVTGSGTEKVEWPQGAVIQNGSNLITPTNVNDELRFIYSAGKIENSTLAMPYDFKIFTDLVPLATGNYRIKVEAFEDLSQTHPLGGDPIVEDGWIDFSIEAPTSGIRVSSDIKERLVYSSTDNQSAKITIETVVINKVTATLEKKEGTLYKEVNATDVSKVLKDGIPTTIPVSGDLTVNFESPITKTYNGEYRIVFKGYKTGETEPIYETNWTFIVCNPPN